MKLAERFPALPFVVPFVVFLLFTGAQSLEGVSPAWMYPLKTIVTGLLLIAFVRYLPGRDSRHPIGAVVLGLVVFALWVLPEGLYPRVGAPASIFNPFAELGAWAWAWIAVRVLGSVLIVAIMEEMFWRAFLSRWLIRSDFRSVAPGTFTRWSFVITTVLFGLEHDRWLVGLLAGAAYNFLYWRTRSVWDCVLAHAVTNGALAALVLVQRDFSWW